MSEGKGAGGERDAAIPDVELKPGLGEVLAFFDYACPFCYVEHWRLKRLAAEYGVTVTPIPFELRPAMPEEGFSAAEHGLAHSERVESYLAALAAKAGVVLAVSDHLPNTHRAMVLAEVARGAGPETHLRMHEAIFDAYYGRGLDIGRPEVLLDLARECGLDADAVERAWETRAYDARLDGFKEVAHRLGVTSTPCVLVCDELIVGTSPYREVAEAAERCLARRGH